MTKKQQDKLVQARDLIFEVEQEWRKETHRPCAEYAANTLYQTRIELNSAMSRG